MTGNLFKILPTFCNKTHVRRSSRNSLLPITNVHQMAQNAYQPIRIRESVIMKHFCDFCGSYYLGAKRPVMMMERSLSPPHPTATARAVGWGRGEGDAFHRGGRDSSLVMLVNWWVGLGEARLAANNVVLSCRAAGERAGRVSWCLWWWWFGCPP